MSVDACGAIYRTIICLAAATMFSGRASAQETDLAKQLNNPVSSLISVPFQVNYDPGFEPDEAPEGGPEGFGSRFSMTLLFPK